KKSFKGEIYLIITAIMWSSGGLLIKLLPDLNGFVINGLRSIVALLVLFIIGGRFPKFNKTIICAGVAHGLCATFFVVANKYTTSANAIVMQNTAPIILLIITAISTRKMPKMAEILILLSAFVGIILIFFDQIGGGNLIGNILGILAGVSFATMFYFNGKKDADAHSSSMIGFFLSFIIGIPFYFSIETFGMSEILPLLGLGIFQLGIPYLFFSIGVKLTTPTTASIIALIEAILNPVWVFVFVGEAPGVFGIIGFFIVIVAVVVKILYDRKSVEKIEISQENI
ncbi:MAG: DMT family transporter, partial [Clostridia bacterium]